MPFLDVDEYLSRISAFEDKYFRVEIDKYGNVETIINWFSWRVMGGTK